jgi:hypothetical protein
MGHALTAGTKLPLQHARCCGKFIRPIRSAWVLLDSLIKISRGAGVKFRRSALSEISSSRVPLAASATSSASWVGGL